MKYRAMLPGDRALFDGEFDLDEHRSVTVFEAEGEPEFSGLLDANGTPIYRVRDRVKFGFVP